MSYAVFAPFYDAVMGDRATEADHLRGLIEKYHPTARTLLELACGTGAVLEQLQPSYDVAGVDLSPAMLDLARAKLRRRGSCRETSRASSCRSASTPSSACSTRSTTYSSSRSGRRCSTAHAST